MSSINLIHDNYYSGPEIGHEVKEGEEVDRLSNLVYNVCVMFCRTPLLPLV
jgi:hypothetical protein